MEGAAQNHFVRSATGEGKATAEGFPTESIKRVYLNLAKGEVGTIITSLTGIAAYYREAAEKLAADIDTTVILTGGVRSLQDMEMIMNESKVQYFGMSRPFMMDSNYLLRIKKSITLV